MPKPKKVVETPTETKVQKPEQSKKSEKNKKPSKAQKKAVEDQETNEEIDQEYNEEEDPDFEADVAELEDDDEDIDLDEDDEGDEFGEDDDIYIPKKKSKISDTKSKVTKGAQKGAAEGENKKSKSQDKTKDANKNKTEEKGEKAKKSKADRFNKKDKDVDHSHRGILYVSHLPYGFVEEGLKEYFGSYGEILNIQLARSKTTGRSKGFAFIEYRFKEVAKVAASSMNGYLVYGRKLECKVIEDDENVKVKTKKFKYIPYNKIFVEQKNKSKTSHELQKEVKNLLKLEEKKRQHFKSLGIEYDFPGFKGVLSEAKQETQ